MSLVPTAILKAIVKVSKDKGFQRYEGRLPNFGAIQAALDNTELLVPRTQLESARKAPQHPVEIPVMNEYDATLLTARACVTNPDTVTTALFPLTWSTTGFVVKEFSEGVYAQNYFTREEHFSHQMSQGLKAAFLKIETDLITFLEANKSEVNASPLFPDVVANARVVLAADRLKFYRSIEAIMSRNDLPQDGVLDITNTESVIEYEFIGQQGRANSTNTAYQIRAVVPYRTNRISPTEDFDEIHYLIAPGGIGMLTWNSADARANARVGEHEYITTIGDPIFGFTWDLKVDKKCENLNATYLGHTWGITTQYAFYLDYAFLTSYLSEEDASVILKYVIGASDYELPVTP